MKFFSLLYFLLIVCNSLVAQAKFEFRAAWVATVDNIDWPSKVAVGNVALQKQEFIDLLDMHARNGLNAVIVQIRPATDALYPSTFEPWSQWLTGKQGVPPDPYYDPLAFMITETHRRGMEFHAWINPYRAVFNIKQENTSATHITRLHPEWFLTYGNVKFFDPGQPAVWDFIVRLIRDVVKHYPVDAIHFDDYFYPYRIANKEFPDTASYVRYNRGLSREDWRRSNVDSVIAHLSQAIKQENPHCKFGISPFGVWRNSDRDPEGSVTKAGQTNYDDLYANILLWLKKGWLDYVAPQLYWERGHKLVAFETLLNWWHIHTYGAHLYIGIGLYRAASTAIWRNEEELPAQLTLARAESQGAIYFSSVSFVKNLNGWNDSIEHHFYKQPALVPQMSWIDSVPPPPPEFIKQPQMDSVSVQLMATANSEPLRCFAVYRIEEQDATGVMLGIYKLIPAVEQKGRFVMPSKDKGYRWFVTAVDLLSNESRPVSLQ